MGKFKVGDRIIQPGWNERDTCTVVSIGETRMTVRDDRGCTGSYTHLAPFVKVKPAITIEPGKHYRLRNGKVTGRISQGDIGFEALVDGQVKVFDKAGGAVFGGEDIVEAWVPKVGERVRLVKDGKSTTGAVGKAATLGTWDTGTFMDGDDYLLDIDPPVDYRTASVKENFTRATIDCFEPLLVAAPAQPAVLTIQQGKFYKTRDGRKVGPAAEHDCGDGYPFEVEFGYWVSDRGEAQPGSSGPDLIAEWVDEPVVAVANDNVEAAKPKFKVGDRVFAKYSDVSGNGTVFKVDALDDNMPYLVDIDGHGELWCFAKDVSIATTPAPTAIVALIEDGAAKPSIKPKVHSSQADATAEAERLALAYPGQLFGVFVLADSKIADVINVPTPVLRAA